MRDKTIDGFRALAALGVVFAHAVNYRFASLPGLIYAQALSEPLAQTSVQVFFVISGFIITSLLLAEEAKRGRFSLPAFYARRVCRIMPPLVVMYAALIALGHTDSLLRSATFTCNLWECSWYVAHTWSLAVEEQFYLCWPLLLLLVPRRASVLAMGIGALLVGFLTAPFAWHSNYISFACIGVGALYACSERVRSWIVPNLALWFGCCAVVLVGPLFVQAKALQALAPLLIAYLVFAARGLPIVRAAMELRLVQWIATGSYSLYLWQQLFLGPDSSLPVMLLPVAVFLSVVLVEQPFIAFGRKWSRSISARSPAAVAAPGV